LKKKLAGKIPRKNNPEEKVITAERVTVAIKKKVLESLPENFTGDGLWGKKMKSSTTRKGRKRRLFRVETRVKSLPARSREETSSKLKRRNRFHNGQLWGPSEQKKGILPEGKSSAGRRNTSLTSQEAIVAKKKKNVYLKGIYPVLRKQQLKSGGSF